MKRIKRITGILMAVLSWCIGVQPACADAFLIENDSDGTYEYHFLIMNEIQEKVFMDGTGYPYMMNYKYLTFNPGNKSVNLTKAGAEGYYTGTLTDNTNRSTKKCELLTGRKNRLQDNDKVWGWLSSNNLRRAFIKICKKGQQNGIAIPVTVKFIAEPWVDTKYRQCGLLSVTSDNPKVAELGKLSCPYYLTRESNSSHDRPREINLIMPDGTDQEIEWPENSLLRNGIFKFSYPDKTLPDMGEVKIELEIYF